MSRDERLKFSMSKRKSSSSSPEENRKEVSEWALRWPGTTRFGVGSTWIRVGLFCGFISLRQLKGDTHARAEGESKQVFCEETFGERKRGERARDGTEADLPETA